MMRTRAGDDDEVNETRIVEQHDDSNTPTASLGSAD